jgi:hypothetical protein
VGEGAEVAAAVEARKGRGRARAKRRGDDGMTIQHI